MTTYMSALQEGQKVESRLLVSHLPLTLTSFEINFGVMVKKIPGMTAVIPGIFFTITPKLISNDVKVSGR